MVSERVSIRVAIREHMYSHQRLWQWRHSPNQPRRVELSTLPSPQIDAPPEIQARIKNALIHLSTTNKAINDYSQVPTMESDTDYTKSCQRKELLEECVDEGSTCIDNFCDTLFMNEPGWRQIESHTRLKSAYQRTLPLSKTEQKTLLLENITVLESGM
jgi:hypothetical protein